MNRLLIIVPDYASHYWPLSAIGVAWKQSGGETTVATGPGLNEQIQNDGLEHEDLILGGGSNSGILRPEEQELEEEQRIQGFFNATRSGAVDTLLYQANARRDDLLWRPEHVARTVLGIVEKIAPNVILIDHLAFGATLGLVASGLPFATFVTGHPSALTTDVDSYGIPHQWPPSMSPLAIDQERLKSVCREVNRHFADDYNKVLAKIEPSANPVANPFGPVGDLTLVNYPAGIHTRWRHQDAVHFLGSCVRTQALPGEFADRVLPSGVTPRVYVSLGTFLSARSDVLARIVSDLEDAEMGAYLATGSAKVTDLPRPPDDWITSPHLPQVALLDHADAVVCHGGNNTMTEALTAGLPILSLPFSTDQFAGSHDLEQAGLGRILDPNGIRPGQIAGGVQALLGSQARTRAAELGSELRSESGATKAVNLLQALASA